MCHLYTQGLLEPIPAPQSKGRVTPNSPLQQGHTHTLMLFRGIFRVAG